MFAVPPLLLSALIRWSNAMRLPSGDQLNCPTVKSPSSADARLLLATSITQRCDWRWSCSTISKSPSVFSRSFIASDFASLEVKAIDAPSGDHAKLPTPSSIDVSLRAFATRRIDQIDLPLVVSVRGKRETRSVRRPRRRRARLLAVGQVDDDRPTGRRRARSRCDTRSRPSRSRGRCTPPAVRPARSRGPDALERDQSVDRRSGRGVGWNRRGAGGPIAAATRRGSRERGATFVDAWLTLQVLNP